MENVYAKVHLYVVHCHVCGGRSDSSLMALLTFANIVMRIFWAPIPGVYEVVGFLGVAVAGFVLPRSSLMKAHVGVDLVVEKASLRARLVVLIITRILVAAFFLIGAWYFVDMAHSFIATKNVTMTERSFYPVVFVMAFSFVVEAIVAVYQMFEREEKGNE